MSEKIFERIDENVFKLINEELSLDDAIRIFAGYGVDPTKIPSQNLKTQYLNLVKQNHPDVGGDLEKMTRINSAWDVLKNQDLFGYVVQKPILPSKLISKREVSVGDYILTLKDDIDVLLGQDSNKINNLNREVKITIDDNTHLQIVWFGMVFLFKKLKNKKMKPNSFKTTIGQWKWVDYDKFHGYDNIPFISIKGEFSWTLK